MVQAVKRIGGERARAGVAVALLHALLAFGLLAGLGVEVETLPREALKLFEVRAEPPPPPVSVPAPVRVDDPEGAAAPPARKARPTPVVAARRNRRSPVAAVPEPKPPRGSDAAAGASTDGPGSGSGGQGSGVGAGGSGSGTGGGGRPSRARRISGALADSDYPLRGPRSGVETVSVRFTVGTDGRVTGCRVTRSSGNPPVDSATCRLIEQRFRYRPATAPNGDPVPSIVSTTFDWIPPSHRRR
ncbi:energy transducer TonB [Allosphingosinicella sp.]|uniref:energy transducer TonB n=1 Tax=Allosphingosinicella sp. TaxID=2823234 RepID=UPI002F13F9A7